MQRKLSGQASPGKTRRLMVLSVILCLALFMIMERGFSVLLWGNLRSSEGVTYGFSISTLNNPYCSYIEGMLRSLIGADGNRLITRDPQYDIAKQCEQIDYMLDNGVDLIFLCPINDVGIISTLERCREKNVPVINFDCAVSAKELVDGIVVSDNYKAGLLCAQNIRSAMPEGAEIAVLDDQKAPSVIDRMNGFADGLAGYGGEIVARVDTDGSLEESLPEAKRLLQEHPEIDVFMCANDTVASAVVAAIEILQLNDPYPMVYGIDGSPDAKALIRDRKMTATVAQSPRKIAEKCYEMANKKLSGEVYEPYVVIDVSLIDGDNLDSANLSGWQ